MKKPVEIAIIGAGQRGTDNFGRYVLGHSKDAKVVAVAELRKDRRDFFAKQHNLAPEMAFESWEAFVKKPKMCAAVINSTVDQAHEKSSIALLEKGYDILLEKPISTSPQKCVNVIKTARKNNKLVMICHVLRYTPFFQKVKEIVDSGILGKILTYEHKENLSYSHMAHSFVRGNWRRKDEESPMILQKCCHDMDIIYWLLGRKCVRLFSSGHLSFFKEENAPRGSAKRCISGCKVEKECPWSAIKLYVNAKTKKWPVNVITMDVSMKGRVEAVKKGPYGRCVFHCDNTVVDHQQSCMEFEGGITVNFTMNFNHEETRTIKVSGSRASLQGHMGKNEIIINHYLNDRKEIIKVPTVVGGHSGGDPRLIKDFIEALQKKNTSKILTSAETSLESHLMAFAHEESRLRKKLIKMADYRKRFGI
ncbi:MAG: Gfo/Idh/MocA family oxidoreductase [Candidatus Omnitrophota bacterium]